VSKLIKRASFKERRNFSKELLASLIERMACLKERKFYRRNTINEERISLS